jgi:hypothetical protein
MSKESPVQLQSIVFDKKQGWNLRKARKYLLRNGYKADKPYESSQFITYKQNKMDRRKYYYKFYSWGDGVSSIDGFIEKDLHYPPQKE